MGQIELLLALVVGLLYAAGLYMLFRRSFIKIIIGLVFLGHGTNLLIFTAPGVLKMVGDASYPFVPEGAKTLPPGTAFADPVPQALILTAIVISFAIVSYTIVLVKRTYQEVGTDDLDQLTSTDQT